MSSEFEADLEDFEANMKLHLNEGLESIKESLSAQEFKLRNDLHSAIGGFTSYMRNRYSPHISKEA